MKYITYFLFLLLLSGCGQQQLPCINNGREEIEAQLILPGKLLLTHKIILEPNGTLSIDKLFWVRKNLSAEKIISVSLIKDSGSGFTQTELKYNYSNVLHRLYAESPNNSRNEIINPNVKTIVEFKYIAQFDEIKDNELNFKISVDSPLSESYDYNQNTEESYYCNIFCNQKRFPISFKITLPSDKDIYLVKIDKSTATVIKQNNILIWAENYPLDEDEPLFINLKIPQDYLQFSTSGSFDLWDKILRFYYIHPGWANFFCILLIFLFPASVLLYSTSDRAIGLLIAFAIFVIAFRVIYANIVFAYVDEVSVIHLDIIAGFDIFAVLFIVSGIFLKKFKKIKSEKYKYEDQTFNNLPSNLQQLLIYLYSKKVNFKKVVIYYLLKNYPEVKIDEKECIDKIVLVKSLISKNKTTEIGIIFGLLKRSNIIINVSNTRIIKQKIKYWKIIRQIKKEINNELIKLNNKYTQNKQAQLGYRAAGIIEDTDFGGIVLKNSDWILIDKKILNEIKIFFEKIKKENPDINFIIPDVGLTVDEFLRLEPADNIKTRFQ